MSLLKTWKSKRRRVNCSASAFALAQCFLNFFYFIVSSQGFDITFTDKITDTDFSDLIELQSWVYRDAPEYGSEELGLRKELISAAIKLNDNTLELALKNLEQPKVHPMQTARVYQLEVSRTVFKHASSKNAKDKMQAYYTLYQFK